ncbi:MAG: NAD(P)-dependent alcohol dehydrogenase [Solirubrobacteraceae bacterium]
MKAVRLHEYKRPPSVDEIDQPDLESHDDVLVRVGGAGVCRTDLHLVDGWFADVMPAEVPFTLGHETAGWVEAVGRNVTNVAAGDPVIVHPLKTCGICWGCRHGEDMYCDGSTFPGVNADGGYAEYLRTGARSLVRLPEGVEPADVAPHADAGLTAYRAVRKAKAILQPGQSVAVFGAGGLGHIGIQLLKAMTPAKVIVIDPSPTARDLAASMGADLTLSADVAAEGVLQATEGRGADVVLDFVGENGTPAIAIEIVRQGGTYLLVGYGGELQVPTMLLILKEVTIIGNLVGSYGDLSELIALVSAGRVRLHTVRYDLGDAPQALDDLDNGRVKGRAVLIPNGR